MTPSDAGLPVPCQTSNGVYLVADAGTQMSEASGEGSAPFDTDNVIVRRDDDHLVGADRRRNRDGHRQGGDAGDDAPVGALAGGQRFPPCRRARSTQTRVAARRTTARATYLRIIFASVADANAAALRLSASEP